MNTPGYDRWATNGATHRCERCGATYTDSDGGCGCEGDKPCVCGACDWDDAGRCRQCDTGALTKGRVMKTVHTARKDHGAIHKGDRYEETVTFYFYPNGPSAGVERRRTRLGGTP